MQQMSLWERGGSPTQAGKSFLWRFLACLAMLMDLPSLIDEPYGLSLVRPVPGLMAAQALLRRLEAKVAAEIDPPTPPELTLRAEQHVSLHNSIR
jgi:hypothetical protein